MSLNDTIQDKFATIAARTSTATGSVWAFTAAFLVIVVWALLGPAFKFSDNWQLVINTGTTIVTFLMVFVIQHAQNKETRALQLKLNELIAAMDGASNRLIDVEDLSESELTHLYHRYQEMAHSAERLSPGAKTTVDDNSDR